MLARFFLQPALGDSLPYATFYPAVLIAALALGPRPALLAAVLSGALASGGVAGPTSPTMWNPEALAALSVFLGTCAISIFLVGVAIRRLEAVAVRRAQSGSWAESQGDGVHASGERVAHHQQLISGLLAEKTRDETQPPVSDTAGLPPQQTPDMARIHSEFAGQDDEPVDFQAFARALIGASTARIEVSGGGLLLPRNQANALGVALLECISALASRKAEGQIRVAVSADASRARLRMSELDAATGITTASLADAFLLRATVDQLGGRLRVSADRDGSGIELSFPRTVSAPDMTPERASATLH